MKTTFLRAVKLLGAAGVFIAIVYHSTSAQAPAEEYTMRRKTVLSKLDPNSVFVVRGSVTGSSERVDLNFYYLTGLTDPNGALIIYKPESAAQPPVVGIFTGRSQQTQAPQTGRQSGAANIFRGNISFAQQQTQTRPAAQPAAPPELRESTLPADQFQVQLDNAILLKPAVLYMNISRSQGLRTPLTPDEELLRAARDRSITLEVKTIDPIIIAMRRIKTPYEIKTLQTAIDITGEAIKEAMRSIEAGMYEYQLQAIIEYVYAFNGSKKVGFSTICGSGPNSLNLHWSQNDRLMQNGDVVVVDIGADYNGYTADITRTIPISGTFTKRQKEIYEIVLSAQEAARTAMKPGGTWREVNDAANKALSDGLIRIGLIKDPQELRKYYIHGLGHTIGLTVHDVGNMNTLDSGLIFTIEPGLYIPEENTGIRIEDDYLITETGAIRLSENVPRTAADVEAMCKEKGLDISRYKIKK